MRKITVKLKPKHNIFIGQNSIRLLKAEIARLNLGNQAIVITNKTVFSLHKKLFVSALRPNSGLSIQFQVLPDSERIKSFPFLLKILDKASRLDFRKKVFFICWGGGVVGDLGGFAASIYKRGCCYIQIPTTLLAQIDSSIGGKTAVDLKIAKNLAGSFWQPSLVLNDTKFLKTLNKVQIQEGLSEAIKYALIKDKGLFTFLNKNYRKLLNKDQKCLAHLIFRCAKIKKDIVEKDEREKKGIRTILNFGHTIAHAIEAGSSYRISHGRAVGLGLIAALYLSKTKQLQVKTVKLMQNIGSPTRLRFNKQKAMKALKQDKKFINRTTRLVLLDRIAKTRIQENVKMSLISQALDVVRR